MQIFLRTPAGKNAVLDVDAAACIDDLKQQVCAVSGVPCSEQRLVAGTAALDDGAQPLAECNVSAGSTVQLLLRLCGGRDDMDPVLEQLASKYNCERLICRKCYARLPPKAKNCRKKKCGTCNQLRPKKKLEVKKG